MGNRWSFLIGNLLRCGAGFILASTVTAAGQAADKGGPTPEITGRFTDNVRPLLKDHCYACHGKERQEAKLDLSSIDTAKSVAENPRLWKLIRQRLEAQEMPPEDADRKLSKSKRQAIIDWIGDAQKFEMEQNAGDPGRVLARRLNSAEFDYTIRDLTGVNIRPAREFPVDPASEAGFDNSGESLTMSPALMRKYLAAARLVAEHLVLRPRGFIFAPFPTVAETDRDKYCVQRIIAFYKRHEVDYGDYFLTAWRYRHRQRLGLGEIDLRGLATAENLSPKYLQTIWSVLNDPLPEVGPLAVVRAMWRELPVPAESRDDGASAEKLAREGCQRLRDLVVKLRSELSAEAEKLHVEGISDGSQPFVLWRNRQSAALHMKYGGDLTGDERVACQRFCHDFPRAFVVSDRGPYFDPKQAGQGRLLTAGFHLMQGYFRDDQPLYDLVLDLSQQRELDALWQELNFITQVPLRQYKDFIFFERAEPPRFMREAAFDFARSEDKDATSPEKMKRLAELHIAKARRIGASDKAVQAIEDFYTNIETEIRWVEGQRVAAEASHIEDLLKFAERAWRRPLNGAERNELRSFYRSLRDQDKIGHEEAIRDAIASVLLSPHFCYRLVPAAKGTGTQPLSDHALANRLSYFLWSSMPDAELVAHADSGDLRQREVLLAQTRRMLQSEKIRGLATEFGGNWLDFRRFLEHNGVDRQRFPSFTPDLQQAMFEEPVQFLVDVLQTNRSILGLLDADFTFVNPVLAQHYGIPLPNGTAPDSWIRVEHAGEFGRGGLLPMAVFQTSNSPGLRTSPVKRGYWVVRRLLGEQIPPPPPSVPELPKDEAMLDALSLPQLLARHRADKSCAGCHQRFDAIGLAFEGYGPIGERRTHDLGGRPVEDAALFPDGSERTGLAGLRRYLDDRRRADFVDNFCRKLCAYAFSRGLLLSDEKLLDTMKSTLTSDNYAVQTAIETVILSRQFQYQRGQDDTR